MGTFETTKGDKGGFGSESALAFLRNEVLLKDWQETLEAELVLASEIPVQTLDQPSYSYRVITPDISDGGKEYPADYSWGAKIPRVNWSGFTTKTGVAQEQAFGHLFPYEEINDTGIVHGKEMMMTYAADWIEKESLYGICGRAATIAKTWADGGQFDTFLGDSMNGGYCTTTGATDIVCIGQVDAYEWDVAGGDPIDDITKVCSLMTNQLKAQGTADTTITMNPKNCVMLLDTLSYHALYSYLRDQDVKIVQQEGMSLGNMVVPSLQGLEFKIADRALPTGTVSVGGTATGYGFAILYDKGQKPFKGFQYFPEIHGFSRGQNVGGWDFAVNQGWKDSSKGDYELNMATSVNTATWYPKKLFLWGGFRSAERIA